MPSTQSVLYVASAMISEFAAVDLANLARTPAKAEASGPIMLELLRSRTTVLMVELTPAPLAKMAWAFGRLEMRGRGVLSVPLHSVQGAFACPLRFASQQTFCPARASALCRSRDLMSPPLHVDIADVRLVLTEPSKFGLGAWQDGISAQTFVQYHCMARLQMYGRLCAARSCQSRLRAYHTAFC
eukprot:s699_g20.t4